MASSSNPFAKWIVNYGYHTPKERDGFLMNYKPRIGNLTNNTAQRLICDYRYFKDKKIKIEYKNSKLEIIILFIILLSILNISFQ